MTNQTYYIDFNGGDDANDGLSFANRKKTFDGLISENDNSSNQAAHGDEYRVMGMPTINTGVNATWTQGGYHNRDANGNNDATKDIQGATATAPIEITCNNHSYSTGDIVWIFNVSGIFSANGSWIITVTGTNTFTLNNSDGTTGKDTGSFSNSELPHAKKITYKGIKVNTQCKRIAFCSGSTQTSDDTHNINNNLYPVSSSNVTTNNGGWTHNIRSIRTTVANGFTTGKCWYYTLPEELDLSAYQGISFTYYNSNDTDAQKSNREIRLCSDTTGDTAVNTIKIRAMASSGNYSIVKDTGGNLGSSIKSIAFYITSDEGAEETRITNIIAFKTGVNDVITHDDVFGKNTTSEPVFWKPYYIQEDHILFGFRDLIVSQALNHASNATQTASYGGTSETVALHKVTPFNIYGAIDENTSSGSSVFAAHLFKFFIRLRLESRTRTNQELTKITGGWNTTDMSSQDSITWVNIFSDNHRFIDTHAHSSVVGANILVERFGQGVGNSLLSLDGTKNMSANKIYQCGFSNGSPITISNLRGRDGTIIDGIYQSCGKYAGVQGSDAQNQSGYTDKSKLIIKNLHLYATGNLISLPDSLYIYDAKFLARSRIVTDAGNNNQTKIYFKNLTVFGLESTYTDSDVRIHNSTISNITNETHPHTVNNQGTTNQGILSFRNYNGTPNDHRMYVANGHIKSETSVRHGTDGVAWKIQPTIEHVGSFSHSAVNNTVDQPLNFTVAKLFVEANKVVTFKAYVRRDNTGITATIAARIFRNIFTLTSDVAVSCTADADTWQELTLLITPIDSGELNIDFEAFGGNSHTAYIDDISVTQAV